MTTARTGFIVLYGLKIFITMFCLVENGQKIQYNIKKTFNSFSMNTPVKYADPNGHRAYDDSLIYIDGPAFFTTSGAYGFPDTIGRDFVFTK